MQCLKRSKSKPDKGLVIAIAPLVRNAGQAFWLFLVPFDIAEGKTGDELAIYYSESVKQIEYPNRLFPEGATRNLFDLKEATLRGKSVLISQNYDIQKSYVAGNTVILETIWTAEIAVPIGQTPAGGKMKAYFAQFIEFEDGKIICQRTYDCFEPF